MLMLLFIVYFLFMVSFLYSYPIPIPILRLYISKKVGYIIIASCSVEATFR